MRKIKEVLRLHYELNLGQRMIARGCSIGLGTVNDYLARAERANLQWPLPDDWGDAELNAALFGLEPVLTREPERPLPDFAALHQERRKSKNVTRQLLWEEYREGNPDGYRYSRFCELYRRWLGTRDVVLRQEHKAGEKVFVDWAGPTIPIHCRTGGGTRQAHLFVAVLGASCYTYAEALADEQTISWLTAHMNTFEFFGGVPKILVPDNTRTGVTRACRYDPDLNPTYNELAKHYGVGVVPARPYKPRDKAKVESGVLVVERWIMAALRNRRFFEIGDLNQAIRELLEKLNNRAFRKREGSRASVFRTVDQPALSALPDARFDLSEWAKARVNIDYHVAFDGNFYSVACAQPWRGKGGHECGASTEEPSGTPGVDTVADDRLGAKYRSEYRAIVRANHGRPAASRDGLSRLPGDYSAREEVLRQTGGSGGGAGSADRRVPV